MNRIRAGAEEWRGVDFFIRSPNLMMSKRGHAKAIQSADRVPSLSFVDDEFVLPLRYRSPPLVKLPTRLASEVLTGPLRLRCFSLGFAD